LRKEDHERQQIKELSTTKKYSGGHAGIPYFLETKLSPLKEHSPFGEEEPWEETLSPSGLTLQRERSKDRKNPETR